jgi:50S ribosomal protein L16 3-hydroxylase
VPYEGAVFGSLSPGQFLERHWQRAPGWFPAAMPRFRPPITPDELAGLACEEEVESRLVVGNVGTRFQLEHGPFEEDRFERLPRRDWTLLVQDVDKHLPEVARLLEPFRFLPDWRIDDIMVSFAAPGGSVGPHTDQYDVFLLQAQGRRRWQLSERFEPVLREDCDIKVLEKFEPERELIAEPGDILYLPPNVAHFGVALDEAMTFSIGFRAPDQRELAAALARELATDARLGERFTDAGRAVASDATALEPSDLERLRDLLRRGLAASDAELDAFIGRYLTRGKHNLEAPGEPSSADEVRRRLERGERLVRRPGSRWTWFLRGDELWVFAEGHEQRLAPNQQHWLEPLLAHTPLGAKQLGRADAALAGFAAWLERGALEWHEDDGD